MLCLCCLGVDGIEILRAHTQALVFLAVCADINRQELDFVCLHLVTGDTGDLFPCPVTILYHGALFQRKLRHGVRHRLGTALFRLHRAVR